MSEHPHLVCAYRLDGNGGGEAVDWPAVRDWTPEGGKLWVHLEAEHPDTETWLQEKCGLSPFVVDGLLASETRPRCDAYEDGTLLILRGVNLNPDADPEDMVSLRVWLDRDRVISTRLRRLLAVEDVREQLAAGKGPVSTGHLVARIAARLIDRMGPVIDGLGDEVAGLEHRLVDPNDRGDLDLRSVRYQLAELRRVAIALRRYIAPQRDALDRFGQLHEPWMDKRTQGRVRETVDRVTRVVEALDEVRERSVLVQDELGNRISQRMERTMYVLTVVATVMLPLGFLTGLLGVNVAGIPGTETPWAFWAMCAALVVMAVFEVLMFKWLRWL